MNWEVVRLPILHTLTRDVVSSIYVRIWYNLDWKFVKLTEKRFSYIKWTLHVYSSGGTYYQWHIMVWEQIKFNQKMCGDARKNVLRRISSYRRNIDFLWILNTPSKYVAHINSGLSHVSHSRLWIFLLWNRKIFRNFLASSNEVN